MPAEQHLSPRAAVEENGRWTTLAGLRVRWQEQLSVHTRTIGGTQDDLGRLDERRRREVVRHSRRRDVAKRLPTYDRDACGQTRVGTQHERRLAIARHYRAPLDPLSAR